MSLLNFLFQFELNTVMNAPPKYLPKSELCKAHKIKTVVKDLKALVYGKVMKCLVYISVFFFTKLI